jgi:hypothetical protein
MRASSPCRCHSPVVSSLSSLPSHWPHLPRCRVVVITIPLPFLLLWWVPLHPCPRVVLVAVLILVPVIWPSLFLCPCPAVLMLSLSRLLSSSPHRPVVVVVAAAPCCCCCCRCSLSLSLSPSCHCSPFPPCEQLLAVVVGGAAVVGIWSCYHLTTPRAGARGSGGVGSGGASRCRQ